MRFLSLPGLTKYGDAQAIQQDLVEKRLNDAIEDTVLFLEHAPVITRGRGLQRGSAGSDVRHMPIPTPLPEGVELAETERGGDLTAHMPGQLVVYPIFKLDGATTFCGRNDVDGFLRSLEQVVIDELAEEGLSAERRPLATGVWIDGRKIASIGIAVRRNVTYHGLALNLVNDLGLFRLISPCGFSSEVMTRLEDLRPKGLGSWRPHWEWRIAQRFERLSTPTGQFRVPDLVVYSESNSTRGTG